jgi:hypothetical protein
MMKQRETFQNQLIKLCSLFAGFGFTLFVLMIVYGDQAVIFILKGISLQNLVTIFQELNFAELFSWFYFLFLFGLFFFVNRVLMDNYPNSHLSAKQQSVFSTTLDSFKEGSLTFPFVVMIVFPLILQVILPAVINVIVLVELFLPFILIGELYRISEDHLIESINRMRNERSLRLNFQIILVLTFPLGIFVIVGTGLISFLNFVHYNLLWENPESTIALLFWDIMNALFSLLSFNNVLLGSIFENLKFYIVALISLAIFSKIYLILKRFIRVQSIKQIERFILIYQ